jgi:hypothetical protein
MAPRSSAKRSPMPNYRFKAHDGNGSEKLGAAVLTNDDEALAFAKRIIQEMMQGDVALYTTWAMDITAGKRNVGSILFET